MSRQIMLNIRSVAALILSLAIGGAFFAPPVLAQQPGEQDPSIAPETVPEDLVRERSLEKKREQKRRKQTIRRLKENADSEDEKNRVKALERLFELRKENPADPRFAHFVEQEKEDLTEQILGEDAMGKAKSTFERIGATQEIYRPELENPKLNFDISGRATPAGDVNNDGINDYIYSTSSAPDERSSAGFESTPKTAVFLGRPSPRKQPDQIFYRNIVPVGDLNGDGYDDAIVPGTAGAGPIGEDQVRFYAGSDDGYQKSKAFLDTFFEIDDLQATESADLDGDGFEDVIFYDEGRLLRSGRLLVAFGAGELGDVTVEQASVELPSFPEIPMRASPRVGDLDGDGQGAVVLTTLSSDASSGNLSSSLRVFEVGEFGDFNLVDEAQIDDKYVTFSASLADVTGDGNLNVITETFAQFGDRIFTLKKGESAGSMVLEQKGSTFGGAPLGVGDLNGDGRSDFLKQDPTTGKWFVSYTPDNLSDGLSLDKPISFGEGASGSPKYVFGLQPLGDVTGDGVDDAMFSYEFFGAPERERGRRFVLGSQSGVSTQDVTYPIGKLFDQVLSTVTVGDVNGDGIEDFAIYRSSVNKIQVYYGRPTLRSSPDVVIPSPISANIEDIVGGDITGDGNSDIVVSYQNRRRMDVYEGGADVSTTPSQTLTSPSLGFRGIAQPRIVGDINDDGTDDLFLAGAQEEGFFGGLIFNTALIYFGGSSLDTPDRQFSALSASNQPIPIGGVTGVGDMNDDGVDDLAIATQPFGEEVINVFFGGSEPSFSFASPALEIDRGADVGKLAGGDFNGDGAADLAVANAPSVEVFEGGDGVDGEVDQLLDVPAGPIGLGSGLAESGLWNLNATPDADGNGSDEILLGSRGGGALLYRNATDNPVVLTAPNPFGGLGSFPGFSPGNAAGDFNADGTTDFVLTQPFDGRDLGGASSRVYRYEATGLTVAGTPIKPEPQSNATPGETVTVNVTVGSAETPVQNLFGASFKLEYDADRLSVSSRSAGEFMGSDVVFSSNNSEPGVIDVGVTRKDGAGGVSGSGVIASVEFSVSEDASTGSSLPFRLLDLEANTPNEEPINLVAQSERALVYPSSVSASVSETFEGGYKLVALPGAVDRPIADILSGSAGVDWQAYWDTGDEKDPFVKHDGSATFSFRPGRGFWVTANQEVTVDESLSTVSLNDQNEHGIDLHSGWNIISNPLDRDVLWTAVGKSNEGTLQPLWAFEGGSFTRVDTFKSAKTGQAYYFLNAGNLQSLQIPYPIGVQKQKSNPKGKEKQVGRSVRLVTRQDGERMSITTLGTREGAESGLDSYDFIAPPSRFQDVSLRAQSPEESSRGDRREQLAADYRPLSNEGRQFNLTLKATPGEPVLIKADQFQSIEDWNVVLIEESGERYELRRSGSARITPTEEKTSLRLVVGKKSLVEEAASDLVPDKVKLHGSFPNPFREQTTIKYELPETKNVSVAIYDMLGRRVKTLVDKKQDAGAHRIRWSPQSNGGQPLSSGVYFLRLKTETTQRVKKLVVVQ